MTMKIDFLKPNILDEDIREAVKVLKSGWVTAWSPAAKEFSKSFAQYLGAKETVLLSSGTAALHVALLAAGVGKGDEVITTPLSFIASSNVILYVGAKPVFVDVDPQTGLLDISKIERAITKKTKAVLPVHLYGQMVDMKALAKIAKKHKLLIIEDACHALESERGGIRPGQLSFAACFSFHAAKNISSGEGGAIVTNNAKTAERMRSLSDSGMVKSPGKRPMMHFGYKYSFTGFQAALLSRQLARIDASWRKRKKLCENYAKAFQGFESMGMTFPKTLQDAKHGYHMFVLWVPERKRDPFREALLESGIVTDVHFNPIHLEPYYKKTFGYKRGTFPIAEKLGYSTITLPLYPALTEEEQNHIIDTLLTLMDVS